MPVGRLGLGGDEQVDKPAHGGPEQAIYAYAREDLDWWVEQLGRELAMACSARTSPPRAWTSPGR